MVDTSTVLRLDAATCVVGRAFRLGPVDLSLGAGSVAEVVGVNGAGKTTLLRVAAGLLPLPTGRRECDGEALYLRGGAGGREGQRVVAAVEFAAAVAGRRWVDARELLAEVGIVALADRRVGALSAGERARLTVAVALAVRPALLCLDEPFAPLDAAGTRAVVDAISRLAGSGSAVVVASPRPQLSPDRIDARLQVADGMVTGA